MKVHVAFTPAEAAAAPTGIVIDVLRATSTIAQALSVSPKTVDNQTQSIYRKIGAKSRTTAAFYAVEHGIFSG